jgi:hypothetical protein
MSPMLERASRRAFLAAAKVPTTRFLSQSPLMGRQLPHPGRTGVDVCHAATAGARSLSLDDQLSSCLVMRTSGMDRTMPEGAPHAMREGRCSRATPPPRRVRYCRETNVAPIRCSRKDQGTTNSMLSPAGRATRKAWHWSMLRKLRSTRQPRIVSTSITQSMKRRRPLDQLGGAHPHSHGA